MIGNFGIGRDVYHSVVDDFGYLLRSALSCSPTYAALGPIYPVDPAADMLAPFIRSAIEVGVDPYSLDQIRLAPSSVIANATMRRRRSVEIQVSTVGSMFWVDVESWTRAGLVLEVASRRGIHFTDGPKANVRWKMCGTVTGRFGVEHGSFNPLVIPREKRDRIIPCASGRSVVVIDFNAMDLRSMISLVPGLANKYVGATDLHGRTAEIVGIDRNTAKRELFIHSYGGNSAYAMRFGECLPELRWLRDMPTGVGARLVQSKSAAAFRAGLSKALPLLVGDDVRPMFTVHDELTLDVLNESIGSAAHVSKALETGASECIGVAYTTGVSSGKNYLEAKRA